MSDYIKREDAINIVCDACNDNFPEEPCEPSDCIIFNALKEYPAADVVEQKRGKWIWDDEGYHCSECFFHAYGNTGEILSGVYNFCPNCGARMVTDDV